MEKKINKLIKDYKLDVEGKTQNKTESENSIGIMTGSNEGYYVCITENNICYNLRTHSKDEALKILGVMLILLP